MKTIITIGFLLAVVTWPSAADATASKHALLIGIGDYTHEVTDLEGPPHDIEALKRLLIERWGFDARNVTVLLDKEATKQNILAAIGSLPQKTSPGDIIFLYFSGHGTSSYELADVGLDGNTGALVPADLTLEAADLRASLIVGSRDLRPLLEKLDKDRQVFAVFDACYSGAAVRNLRALGRPRYIALPTRGVSTRAIASTFAEEEDTPFGSLTAKSPPYPYSNVLYISAASKSEAARDITTVDIRMGRAQTVDGQPHGALTNALLNGLMGSGDTNRDGNITYGELYGYIRDQVSEKFPQQPQLLVPEQDNEGFRARRVLELPTPVRPPAAAPPRPKRTAPPVAERSSLRVRLENLPPEVEKAIRAIPGLVVATGEYDALVALETDGFRLYHGSGDVLASYSRQQRDEVVERVARQVAVQELIDLSYPDQDLNVTVSIPGNRGFLKSGERFSIDFAAEKTSFILLLNIDNGGYVSVLYPFEPEELTACRSGSFGAPDQLKVSPPFGTEYLKIFAFQQKPAGYDALLEASFSALGPELPRPRKLPRSAEGSKGQARLKVVTRETGS